MKHLELNINKIRRISEEKEEENYEFRVFLKGQDSNEVDAIVHELNKEITSQIDCTKCGNCCISLRPCVDDSEIKRLAKLDGISVAGFKSKFIGEDDFDHTKYLKDIPCKYLAGKTCSIYPERPEDCRSYPHTHKSHFTSRTLGMIENYGICPIVFNVFEQLKEELDFYYY